MTPRAIPSGYRAATPAEAREWKRGDGIEVWDSTTAQRYAATVERWTAEAVWVRVCDADAVSAAYWPRVALEVYDADFGGEPFDVQSRGGRWVAVEREATP